MKHEWVEERKNTAKVYRVEGEEKPLGVGSKKRKKGRCQRW